MHDAPTYLDHNASTPVLPRVRDAMLRALEQGFGNPSAEHPYGKRARAFVDRAREQVAALLGCDPDEIIFTGGGTESNNLAIRGVTTEDIKTFALVTSVIDHPATLEPAKILRHRGACVTSIGVNEAGLVSPAAASAAIEAARRAGAATVVVSLILAQNETGVIQPIAPIAQRARALGSVVHTDAAQAVGKIPVRPRELGVDMLSIAGHKLYAPKGVGALYLRRGVAIHPLVAGAGHERGKRPGTENVPGIAALGEACAAALEDLALEAKRQETLRDRLEAMLGEAGFIVHGAKSPRLPNTTNGRFPGVRGSDLMRLTPELAFTTGSACHAGEERPSAILTAMGVADEDALGAIRLTLGRGTTDADIDQAAALLKERARRPT